MERRGRDPDRTDRLGWKVLSVECWGEGGAAGPRERHCSELLWDTGVLLSLLNSSQPPPEHTPSRYRVAP